MSIKFIDVLPVITGAISIGVALFGIKQVCDVVAQTKEQQEEICEVVNKAESEGFETDEEAIDAKMKLVSKVQENHKKVFIGAACIFGAVSLMGVTWAISAKANAIVIDNLGKDAAWAGVKKGVHFVSSLISGDELTDGEQQLADYLVSKASAQNIEDLRAQMVMDAVLSIDPEVLRSYGFEVKHV